MSRNATKPGLTAAMTVGRALLAAGWRYDSTTPMADDTTERLMLHPSGREIAARTSRDGERTALSMTGLTLEQAAGAVAGAGLTAPEATCRNCKGTGMDSTRHLDVLEDHPCGYCHGAGRATPAVVEQVAVGPHAELAAGLRALADFIEANPTMPALTYPSLLDTGPVGESDTDGVNRVRHIADLLGVTVVTSRAGHLTASRQFAGLGLRIAHVPTAASAQHEAHMTYADNVQPEPQDGHVYSCCGKTGRISPHQSWCPGGAR